MVLLLVKVLVAPVLIAGGTLAQRRWGPAIGGRVIGLPLTALPLLALMTIVDGTHFAATAATANQAGGVAQAAWCLSYAVAARRLRPAAALAVATSVFALLAVAAGALHLSLLAGTVTSGLAIVAGLALWPAAGRAPEQARPWRWELPVRMAVAAGFTFVLSEWASALGAAPAGLVGAFPVLTVILAVAVHGGTGPVSAERFLHGVLAASWSVVAALFVLAAALPRTSPVVAFVGAVLAALAAQSVGRPGVLHTVRHAVRVAPWPVHERAAARAAAAPAARACTGAPVAAVPVGRPGTLRAPRPRPSRAVDRRRAASVRPRRDPRRTTPVPLPQAPR